MSKITDNLPHNQLGISLQTPLYCKCTLYTIHLILLTLLISFIYFQGLREGVYDFLTTFNETKVQ